MPNTLILGAGFAGSLLALVLKRIGRECVLVERGTHPRFAIGESSTPTANLVLAEICRRYDLPRVAPLAKYGPWTRSYPEISCGLKRGFSFFKHQVGRPLEPAADHRGELLVGANPNNEQADTHWFREHVDHFLLREALAAEIPYYDRTEITSLEHDGQWRLEAVRNGERLSLTAPLVIDATGPGGALCRALGISTEPIGLATNSWSVYSHFTGVDPWQEVLGKLGGRTGDHPYPCDAAALHHVLDDGWIWVLRFNNGVTSAGVAFDGEKRPPDCETDASALWRRTLDAHPSLARQFAGAQPIREFVKTGRMQRRAARLAGANWALLPHAAYFLDPLFSGGNAHTLLGILRLAEILESSPDATALGDKLADYEQKLQAEITFLDWLIHGCYRLFGRFDLLGAYVMYYFAGAIQSELSMLRGDGAAGGFLWSGTPHFRDAVERTYRELLVSTPTAAELYQRVAADIAAYNPAGLCDADKHGMYPFV